jgi:rubrerythrin
MKPPIALIALALLGTDEPPQKPIEQAHMLVSPLTQELPKVQKPSQASSPEPHEDWSLTLRVAVRIALDNCEICRVIWFGAQGMPIGSVEPMPSKTGASALAPTAGPNSIVILPLAAKTNRSRFRAEVAAQIRWVEQAYWKLAQAHAELQAADRAANLAQEILKGEQAELSSHGTNADLPEAIQRVKQFKLEEANRVSDMITSERQLRSVLGLPPADNRRIIPVTPPLETRLEAVWEECVDAILDGQTIPEQAQSWARSVLEIDAKHRELVKAKQLANAAAKRLATQRAYYDDGRITVNRFLDAVNQSATAESALAERETAYNVAIVTLNETMGTLPAIHGVVVHERTHKREFSQPLLRIPGHDSIGR